MMKFAFVILATICAVSNAQIFDIVEDEFGGEYALVPLPLSRQRRQTTADINKRSLGTRLTLGHQGTIWGNDNHKVPGCGFASEQVRPTRQFTAGRNVEYEHIPSVIGCIWAAVTPKDGLGLSIENRNPIFTEKYEYKDKLTRNLERETLTRNLDSSSNSRLESSFITPSPTHEIFGKALAENSYGVGVGLGYRHIPSGSELTGNVRHNYDSGEARIGGKLNLHKSENSQLDAFADYSKHYRSTGFDDSRGRVGIEFKRQW
ncbi:hypothetical protein HHI36_009572 [Cryptolaemus montrouzieri]|uniref:Uncharacterized protein n=1 Tax=Cryptolaemus montrouzieri TaxID=559131 RepID=A0ABD2MG68_9CUCU